MMRVLMMGPYPPPYGGIQTHLVALRDRLLATGSECPVINLTSAPDSGTPGVHYPRSTMGVIRLLATLKYDLIHLHIGGDLSAKLVSLCAVCSLIPGKPTLLTFHSGGYPSSAAGLRARPASFRGAVLRRLDGIVAVNQEQIDLFRRFGCRAERLRLIPPFSPDAATRLQASTGLAPVMMAFFRSHHPVLVTVGLLEPEYDLSRQVEALPILRQALPDAGLIIIGSGSLRKRLEAEATAAGGGHVLLCGDVPHAETVAAIAAADLFLRTTLYDGDSISVREALSLGTPVVATDTGMRPAGVNLVPLNDVQALVQGVKGALAGARPAREPDDTADHIGTVLDLYRSMLS